MRVWHAAPGRAHVSQLLLGVPEKFGVFGCEWVQVEDSCGLSIIVRGSFTLSLSLSLSLQQEAVLCC